VTIVDVLYSLQRSGGLEIGKELTTR